MTMDANNVNNEQTTEASASGVPPPPPTATLSRASSSSTENSPSVGGNVARSRWHSAALLSSSSVQVNHRTPYFLFDPDSSLVFYWTAAVALSTVYNAWMVVLRIAFSEVREQSDLSFLGYLDTICDLVYLLDIIVHLRTAYLLDGIPVFDPPKIRQQYTCQASFVRDVVAILPTENIVGFLSEYVGASKYFLCTAGAARLSRLVKFHALYRFYDLAESRMSTPHCIRVFRLSLSLVIVIHWIACLYYLVSESEGLGSNDWVYTNDPDKQKFLRKYIVCLYWSAMTLTTIGNCNPPETDLEYVFTGVIFLTGVFVFATVLGNVGDVISSMNANRQEFQARMDNIKMYLTHKKVPASLQIKIKKWAEYTWSRTKATDESRLLNMLPERLRAEVAVHVHLDSLKKVKIFEQCEVGFLCELVLKLRSQVFSPGDFVCKAGETGREMYIINHGKVEVLVTSPVTNKEMVVAVLSEGNYFGEISLLRLDGVQNRRTADVRSIGYSELLTLSRKDLMSALVEYPDAKAILESQAKQRMKTNIQAQRAFSVDALMKNSQESADNGSLHREDLRGQEMTEIKAMIEELKTVNKLVPGKTIWQLIARCEILQTKVNVAEKELLQNRLQIFQLETLLKSRNTRKFGKRAHPSHYQVRDSKRHPCPRITKQYSQEEGRYCDALPDPLTEDSVETRSPTLVHVQFSKTVNEELKKRNVSGMGYCCNCRKTQQTNDFESQGWDSEDTIVEEDITGPIDSANDDDEEEEVSYGISRACNTHDASENISQLNGNHLSHLTGTTTESHNRRARMKDINGGSKSELVSRHSLNKEVVPVEEVRFMFSNGLSRSQNTASDHPSRIDLYKELSIIDYVVDITSYSGNDDSLPDISSDFNSSESSDEVLRALHNDVHKFRFNSACSSVSDDDSSSRRNSAFSDSDYAGKGSDTENEKSD